MKRLLASFPCSVVLAAMLSTAVADDATYVRDLTKKGYLQQVRTVGNTTTVVVGPKFDRLNALSAKEEVCAAVLRHVRATNRQVGEFQLVSGNGEPVGHFDGSRLNLN